MELKKLIKNTSFLLSARIVQFGVGIIRTKINAIYLGTTGIGIFSQLTFLTERMSQFATLSMSDAVVKQIAERSQKKEIKTIVSSSLKAYITLVFSFMVISIILLNIFSEKLTFYVFGDIKYIKYFFIALFSFPILILNSIPFSILKGFKNIRAISRARIATIIANIIIFLPLVILFQLDGAVAFVPLSYIVTLIFNYFYARQAYLKPLNIKFMDIIISPYKFNFIREMIVFSGFGLIVTLWIIVSEFICRSIVIENLGVDSLGLYNPIIAWAALFTGFLLPTFSTYLFPRFSEAKSKKEVSGILNDAIRLGTLLLIPLLFLAIPYKDLFIQLLYSSEFAGAAEYLPFHFLGITFYVWWYAFTQAMTPTGFIKQHGIFAVLFYTLNVLVTLILVPRFGLYGYMLRYIVSPVIFFFIYFYFAKRKHNFSLDKKNIILMIYLLAGTIFIILIGLFKGGSVINYFSPPFFLVLTFLFITRKEKQFIYTKVKKFYENFNR